MRRKPILVPASCPPHKPAALCRCRRRPLCQGEPLIAFVPVFLMIFGIGPRQRLRHGRRHFDLHCRDQCRQSHALQRSAHSENGLFLRRQPLCHFPRRPSARPERPISWPGCGSVLADRLQFLSRRMTAVIPCGELRHMENAPTYQKVVRWILSRDGGRDPACHHWRTRSPTGSWRYFMR